MHTSSEVLLIHASLFIFISHSAPEKASRTVFVIQAVSAIILVGTLVAAGITVAQGGPAALADSVTKSGFAAAFTLIFMSEIGDKVNK